MRVRENINEEDLEDSRAEGNSLSERGKKEKEEKPTSHSNQKTNHAYSFKVPEISDESVREARLPNEVAEAAKAFLRVLRSKLSRDTSKNMAELFQILKVRNYNFVNCVIKNLP